MTRDEAISASEADADFILLAVNNHDALVDLVQTLIDNDPDYPIADNGMTVLDGWRGRAKRVLAALPREQDVKPAAQGWKSVPTNPTNEMLVAANNVPAAQHIIDAVPRNALIYTAMVYAAPPSSSPWSGKPLCQNCGDPIAHGIYCGTCREMGCGSAHQPDWQAAAERAKAAADKVRADGQVDPADLQKPYRAPQPQGGDAREGVIKGVTNE